MANRRVHGALGGGLAAAVLILIADATSFGVAILIGVACLIAALVAQVVITRRQRLAAGKGRAAGTATSAGSPAPPRDSATRSLAEQILDGEEHRG